MVARAAAMQVTLSIEGDEVTVRATPAEAAASAA
jgi:hypothetical protein